MDMCKKESKNQKSYNVLQSIRYGLYVFLFCMTLVLSGTTVSAVEITSNSFEDETNTTTTETDTTKEAKKTTGKFVTKAGKKYYKYSDGKIVKNQFLTIKGKTYYFGKSGVMEKGWFKKGKDYYYCDRTTGVQKKGCKVDGIKLQKNGKADKTQYSKKKIDTMIKAKSIMNKVTKPTDSKEKKLKKVFDWVLKHPYKRYRILNQVRNKKGWETVFANDIYKNGKGCCVSEASALAFLAHECGYKTVYLCDDTGHAWVEINGRVYDTLFAETKSYNNYYNSTYKTAKLHRMNKLKI